MSSPSIFSGLPNHLIQEIIKQGYSDGIRDYWSRDIPEEYRSKTRDIMCDIPQAAYHMRTHPARRMPRLNEWVCSNCRAICFNRSRDCFICEMVNPELQETDTEDEDEDELSARHGWELCGPYGRSRVEYWFNFQTGERRAVAEEQPRDESVEQPQR
jgi:hypothetical protein